MEGVQKCGGGGQRETKSCGQKGFDSFARAARAISSSGASDSIVHLPYAVRHIDR